MSDGAGVSLSADGTTCRVSMLGYDAEFAVPDDDDEFAETVADAMRAIERRAMRDMILRFGGDE